MRLQQSLSGMEAEMSCHNPQHPMADHQIDVDCTARLVAGNRKIDRAGRKRRKSGQDGVGEPSAPFAGGSAEDDLTPGRFAKIGRLIGAQSAGAGINFLQTDDVGVDFPQHGRYSRRIIAPVETNAAMDIVGDNSNRGHCRRRNDKVASRRTNFRHSFPFKFHRRRALCLRFNNHGRNDG